MRKFRAKEPNIFIGIFKNKERNKCRNSDLEAFSGNNIIKNVL